MGKASLIHRYHSLTTPKPSKGSFFHKEMSGIRKTVAGRIRALRNQVGRKRARATLHSQITTHVKAARANEAHKTQMRKAAYAMTPRAIGLRIKRGKEMNRKFEIGY